jgi:hypothetical protein
MGMGLDAVDAKSHCPHPDTEERSAVAEIDQLTQDRIGQLRQRPIRIAAQGHLDQARTTPESRLVLLKVAEIAQDFYVAVRGGQGQTELAGELFDRAGGGLAGRQEHIEATLEGHHGRTAISQDPVGVACASIKPCRTGESLARLERSAVTKP